MSDGAAVGVSAELASSLRWLVDRLVDRLAWKAGWVGCDEVLRLLREREAACGGEAERLRGEAERIAELLRVCEVELVRLSTACQVVGELPVVHALAACALSQVPGPRTESVGGRAQVRDATAVFEVPPRPGS